MAEFSAQGFEGDVLAGAMRRLDVTSRKSFSDDTGSGGSGKDSSDAESGGSENNFKVAFIGPGGLGGAMLRHLKDLGDVETVLIACGGRGGIIRHSSPVGPIRGISGGLSRNSSGSSTHIVGATGGEGITTDVTGPEGIVGCTHIFITVPSQALKKAAEELAPHIADGQTVVVVPGGLFMPIAKEYWSHVNVLIFEADTSPYAARTTSAGEIGINGIKDSIAIATSQPTTQDQRNGIQYLIETHLNWVPSIAIFLRRTGLPLHLGTVHHNPAALTTSQLLYEVLLPAAQPNVLALDTDRVNVLAAITQMPQYMVDSVFTIQVQRYGVIEGATTLAAHCRRNPAYTGIAAPLLGDLNAHRYIREDGLFNLPLLKETADIVQVHVPTVDAVIGWLRQRLGAAQYEQDKMTFAKLGFTGPNTREGLIAFITGV